MIELGKFINQINESRDNDKNLPIDQDKVAVGDKVVNVEKFDNVEGKRAEENGTAGVWAVDEADPKDFKKLTPDEEDELAHNNYQIYDRIVDDLDFMVIGKAGWAKTALIESIAKQCGRSVITVYLDKAVATDLDGIPVPSEDKNGNVMQKRALPGWVMPLAQNPDKKYLLFFDELNQAQPDVLNALMPIILKHMIAGKVYNNFIVGAAGNEMNENEMGLSDIFENKALKARLAPLKWHTHDEETWKDAFKYLHKKYDDVIGKEAVDKTYELRNFLSSPRDIDRWIFGRIKSKLDSGRRPRAAQVRTDIMENCIWDELSEDVVTSRSFTKQIDDYTDFVTQYVSKGRQSSSSDSHEDDRRGSKGTDQVNTNDKNAIKTALEKGYFYNSKRNDPENGDDKKYVCAVDNCITEIFDPEITGIGAEIFRKIIKEMEAEGKKPRYQKKTEAKADAKKYGWEYYEEEGFLVDAHISVAQDEAEADDKRRAANKNR